MTHAAAVALAIICVLLSASAQVLMRVGMTGAALPSASAEGLRSVYAAALSTPAVWAGMFCFGLSAALWLLVLARLEVSTAYPLVALGMVLTTTAGVLWLGESFGLYKLAGTCLIGAGVVLLGLGSR